ncbi:hypothetical protein AcV5_010511 [Taiwanofungus camphoratus]|nr:hypothetical protein AcV5_010511 [Antrodia cinnamomea]
MLTDLDSTRRHGGFDTHNVTIWLLGHNWLSVCAPELRIGFALYGRLGWSCEVAERCEIDAGRATYIFLHPLENSDCCLHNSDTLEHSESISEGHESVSSCPNSEHDAQTSF